MAHAYRDDFPLLKSQDVAYLDNAATAQRPQCVLDAVTEFYKSKNANPLRGLYPLSIAATEAYENAREAVRSFLNAKSSREIIFTRNTTESINLVAYSYGLSHVKAGDEVLVSIMEHHSNLLPWQMVCRQTGASLKFMECEMDGTLDLNKVEALITPKTKIVACTHVSNVLGRVNPIRELAVLAHRAGAVLVVDGAQSTPHIPVDVQALDADFFAFSGHKVYGPMGIGGIQKISTFTAGFILVMITLVVVFHLVNSRAGRAIMAIRDNRIAAESVGLNVTWYKLAVFVIAAFFAGCAGVLYGHSLANIKAAAFDYNMSIEILVIVVLGGMGSVPGSVVSAIVLTVLPEALREVADYRMLVYAVVLILVMQATNNPAMKRFFGAACKSLTPKRKERAAL